MKVRQGVAAIMMFLAGTVCWADDQAKSTEGPGKPGPVHEALTKRAGTYTTVATFRMKPDEAGMETHGKAKLTSILGGRFLQEEVTGSLFGQPTVSMHLTGFNDDAKQYEGMWIYTGSTAMMRLVGKSSDDGKTIEWSATFEQGKGEKMTMNVITRFEDDDHFTTTLIAKNPDGSQGPTLETKYTRVH
jgi:hypothetical protein